MRILIATGIFEPESGGPATYTPQLATRLVAAGHEVTVITYSDTARPATDTKYPFKLIRVVRGNKVVNRIKFFFAVLKHARGRDVIYTLDWFAAGLPVALAARLLGKSYIVRIGGDYLWEQKYLESFAQPASAEGSDVAMPVSLKDFYEQGVYGRYTHTVAWRIIRFVLHGAAHVVFNSDVQRELYIPFYELDGAHMSTIYNPMSRTAADVIRDAPTKEIVFFGRLIVMKNVASLVRAFARAQMPAEYTLTIIGDGPQKESLQRLIHELHLEDRVHILPGMPKHAVLERIKNARACILPSWTDIAPNQVGEALVIGVPMVVTAENYLPIRDQLPEMIDPRSVDDIAEKIKMLANDARYAAFAAACKAVHFDRDWDVVTEEHLTLFSGV